MFETSPRLNTTETPGLEARKGSIQLESQEFPHGRHILLLLQEAPGILLALCFTTPPSPHLEPFARCSCIAVDISHRISETWEKPEPRVTLTRLRTPLSPTALTSAQQRAASFSHEGKGKLGALVLPLPRRGFAAASQTCQYFQSGAANQVSLPELTVV